ncbi:MAG TPA: hypothetical protein GXZ35_07960 [Acholeplasmataceae bacterium]|nr:hypothetical protein [Acholeplasmataceae bacterium]
MEYNMIKKELAKLNTNRQNARNKLIRFWVMEKGIAPEEISDRIETLLERPENYSIDQLEEILQIIGKEEE